MFCAITDSIINPEAPLALRLSGQLLLGVVKVHQKKVGYLFQDCNDALVKIKLVHSSRPIRSPYVHGKSEHIFWELHVTEVALLCRLSNPLAWTSLWMAQWPPKMPSLCPTTTMILIFWESPLVQSEYSCRIQIYRSKSIEALPIAAHA